MNRDDRRPTDRSGGRRFRSLLFEESPKFHIQIEVSRTEIEIVPGDRRTSA